MARDTARRPRVSPNYSPNGARRTVLGAPHKCDSKLEQKWLAALDGSGPAPPERWPIPDRSILDPPEKRIAALGAAAGAADEAPSWKLILNAPVEIDA